MLEFRRLFESVDASLETNVPEAATPSAEPAKRVHQLKFPKAADRCDAERFAEVDDILERLTVNTSVVGRSSGGAN